MTAAAVELQQLEAAADAFGIELPAGAPSRLLAYLDLLYQWNAFAGLTRVAREDAVRLHLVDSLTALLSLPAAVELADLGTGAGLPGIPLALVRPDLRVGLVESKRRKCSFLREAVRELGLAGCEVVECDALSLASTTRRWDTVIARAFRQPQEMLDVATDIATNAVVMMAGPALEPTLLALPQSWCQTEDHRLELLGGSEQRRVLRFERSDRD